MQNIVYLPDWDLFSPAAKTGVARITVKHQTKVKDIFNLSQEGKKCSYNTNSLFC
jgi:hypothetical protein